MSSYLPLSAPDPLAPDVCPLTHQLWRPGEGTLVIALRKMHLQRASGSQHKFMVLRCFLHWCGWYISINFVLKATFHESLPPSLLRPSYICFPSFSSMGRGWGFNAHWEAWWFCSRNSKTQESNKCQPRMSRTLCLILFDSRHLSIQCQNLFWTAPDLPSAKMRPAPKTRNTGEAESKLGHHFIQEKPSSQKSRLNRRDPWTLRLKSSWAQGHRPSVATQWISMRRAIWSDWTQFFMLEIACQLWVVVSFKNRS